MHIKAAEINWTLTILFYDLPNEFNVCYMQYNPTNDTLRLAIFEINKIIIIFKITNVWQKMANMSTRACKLEVWGLIPSHRGELCFKISALRVTQYYSEEVDRVSPGAGGVVAELVEFRRVGWDVVLRFHCSPLV